MPLYYPLILSLIFPLTVASSIQVSSFGPDLRDRIYTTSPPSSPAHPVTAQGAHPLNDTTRPNQSSPIEEALRFIQDTLHVPPTSLRLTDHTISNHTGVIHLHFRQILDNLDIINANVNINLTPDYVVLSYGSSLHAPSQASAPRGKGTVSGQGVIPHIPPSHRWSSSASSSSSSTPTLAIQALGHHLNRPLNISTLHERTISSSSAGPHPSSQEYVIAGVPYALEAPKVQQAYIRTSSENVLPVWQ
ncbi:hypothetical protein BJ684DRAFT_17765, partial [Piptocephalis cylindrospora]